MYYEKEDFELYAFVFLKERKVAYMSQDAIDNIRSISIDVENNDNYRIEDCLDG